VTTDDFPKDKFLVFATANGTVKKTAFSEYDKSRREGWIAINLREGDEVVRVVATSGDEDLMVVTYRAWRFVSKRAKCVKSVATRWACAASSCAATTRRSRSTSYRRRRPLRVTDTGFGKRVKVERFNRQGRGDRVFGDQADGRARLPRRGLHDAPRRRSDARLNRRRTHSNTGARGLLPGP